MRCKDCKHWGEPSQWNLYWFPEREEWRDCERPERRAVGTGHSDYGSDLSCAPDFGCIQFEAK